MKPQATEIRCLGTVHGSRCSTLLRTVPPLGQLDDAAIRCPSCGKTNFVRVQRGALRMSAQPFPMP